MRADKTQAASAADIESVSGGGESGSDETKSDIEAPEDGVESLITSKRATASTSSTDNSECMVFFNTEGDMSSGEGPTTGSAFGGALDEPDQRCVGLLRRGTKTRGMHFQIASFYLQEPPPKGG